MNHVSQTTFGDGKGNCFQACVASVLELPLEEVPNFCVDYPASRWFDYFNEWLGRIGLYALNFPVSDPGIVADRRWPQGPPAPCILSGPNHDGVAHSTCWNQGDWWDPNPKQRYLAEATSVIVFCALNPAIDVRARLVRATAPRDVGEVTP